MKTGIITLHKVHNFGSVLQAFSTCKILESIGVEPVIIDYMEPRYTVVGGLKKIIKDAFAKDGWGGLAVKQAALKCVSFLIQRKIFNAFNAKYLPLSKLSYTSMAQICRRIPVADVYITGSDQVWNSDYNNGIDRVHYLDFAPVRSRRIAYAASFGKDALRDEEKNETADLLKKYHALSLRESSGVKIVNELGVQDAQHVLDPTLLLDRKAWSDCFSLLSPDIGEYLLIYSVERSIDDFVFKNARLIGHQLGLPLVFLTQAASLKTMAGCELQLSFSKPIDFLRYFFHAKFAVVSSFHGTAFALNFNRQFVSILPPRFGARPRSLLQLTGLNNRIVERAVDLDILGTPIEYDVVNSILASERRKSIEFLRRSICDQVSIDNL